MEDFYSHQLTVLEFEIRGKGTLWGTNRLNIIFDLIAAFCLRRSQYNRGLKQTEDLNRGPKFPSLNKYLFSDYHKSQEIFIGYPMNFLFGVAMPSFTCALITQNFWRSCVIHLLLVLNVHVKYNYYLFTLDSRSFEGFCSYSWNIHVFRALNV